MQYAEQPTKPAPQPLTRPYPQFFVWGETLGIVLVAIAIMAKRFVRKEDIQEKKENEAEQKLIEVLRQEIAKRDKLIATLHNEVILIRKALKLSGKFSPPVTEERTQKVNHDNTLVHNRENS